MTARADFFTTTQIGPNQELTPEGFLLCKDVAVARTGVMVYGPDEVPVDTGPEGIVRVYREDEDIFNEKTIASALGKSVTNDHPEDNVDVLPENWKELTHGVALNVRRGEGQLDDLLLMDLLITTEEAIKLIQEGKREISLGYEADYTEIEPGKAKQTNIIINHIAIVENGRCGRRCSIKDKENEEAKNMATKNRTTKGRDKKGFSSKIIGLLSRAHKARDAEELAEIIEEAVTDEEFSNAVEGRKEPVLDNDFETDENGDTHIHIHTGSSDEEISGIENKVGDDESELGQILALLQALNARVEALENKGVSADSTGENGEEGAGVMDEGEELEAFLEEEAPEGIAARDAKKARDSRYLGESMKDTIAMAEILLPGIKMPTYDRAAAPVTTAKKICNLRKKALDSAFALPENKRLFADITGGKEPDLSRMSCGAVRTLFRSAVALKRQANNSAGVRDSVKEFVDASKSVSKTPTIEDINKANREFYK